MAADRSPDHEIVAARVRLDRSERRFRLCPVSGQGGEVHLPQDESRSRSDVEPATPRSLQDAHGAQGPAIAVSGGTVAVAWKVDGRVESRISTDGGRSFGSVAQVGVIESTIDGRDDLSALRFALVLGPR